MAIIGNIPYFQTNPYVFIIFPPFPNTLQCPGSAPPVPTPRPDRFRQFHPSRWGHVPRWKGLRQQQRSPRWDPPNNKGIPIINHSISNIKPSWEWLIIDRRKFRSQTSDNMERWKAEQGRGTEKRKIRREKIRRERVRGQTLQMREKVGKSRNTVFFKWFVAPEGRKVGSLKRRVRSQLATGAMKNCTPLWREAHFEAKMYKTPGVRTTFGSCDVEKVHAVVARSTFRSENVQNTSGVRTTFGSCDVEKVHAVVARSTFPSQKCTKHWRSRTTFGSCDVEKMHAVVARRTFWSQNVQNTSVSDDFWKLRCRKSARRCGAKHISKSKVLKTGGLGPLLEVAMSKKCTPLWREAHFQVKSVKNWRSRTTFGSWDVEKVHAVVAGSTFPSQKC